MGIDSRIIWLGGHVISMALIPDVGWKVADPDLGIYWDMPLDKLLQSGHENIKTTILARGFSEEKANKVALKYISMDDNRVTHYPYLPDLYKAEIHAGLLKYLLPFLLILISLLPLKRPKQ